MGSRGGCGVLGGSGYRVGASNIANRGRWRSRVGWCWRESFAVARLALCRPKVQGDEKGGLQDRTSQRLIDWKLWKKP